MKNLLLLNCNFSCAEGWFSEEVPQARWIKYNEMCGMEYEFDTVACAYGLDGLVVPT